VEGLKINYYEIKYPINACLNSLYQAIHKYKSKLPHPAQLQNDGIFAVQKQTVA
jgi:hypothetical protein